MPEIDVYWRFVSSDDQERVLERLRSFHFPDGELIEEGDDVILRLDSASDDAALARALVIRQGVCRETGIDPDRVRLKPGGWGPA